MIPNSDDEDDDRDYYHPDLEMTTDDGQLVEEDRETTKERDGSTDMIPNSDDEDDDRIRKDIASLNKQIDTMSVDLKEVLSGLHLLEEQQRSLMEDLQTGEAMPPQQTRSSESFGNATTSASDGPSEVSSPIANDTHAAGPSPEATQLLPVVQTLSMTAAQVASDHAPQHSMPPPCVQPPAASALETSDSCNDSSWRRKMLNGIV